MAIAKKPKSNHIESDIKNSETAAEAFILGGGNENTIDKNNGRKTPIMMRFDPVVLKKVDTAAKRRGVSRSAWIQFTVSRAIDQGEG